MDLHDARATAPPGPRGRGSHTPRSGAGDLGRLTLSSGPLVPSEARAAVGGWLEGLAPASVVSDVQLLISELATNAFRHAGEAPGSPVRISGRSDGEDLWFEVGDDGPDGPVTRRIPSTGLGGGFGLHLVDALASAWGVTHVRGTQVWFTLPLAARGTSAR